MFGTVAKLKIKPGLLQQFMEATREFENRHVPGFVAEYIYQLDRDANTLMLAVVFLDRESYFANANSPEQHALYLRMMEAVEGEPEWHDGEIIYTVGAQAGQAR